jgi:hypothetical protein
VTETPEPVDDRTPHRVALVVFASVNAVDQTDADAVVRQAVLRELLDSTRRVNPDELPVRIRHSRRDRDFSWDVTIGTLTSLRQALNGGYLRFEPIDRAFPHETWENNL